MHRYLIIFYILWTLRQNSVYGQIGRTMAVEYTRAITEGRTAEVVKGKLFYQEPKRIVIKVTDPINQWMVLEDNKMLIYYPNEQKAFRFSSKPPFSLPIFQAFVGSIKNDLGLSGAGFKLVRHEVIGDTLLTYWAPPDKIKKIMGNTTVGQIKDVFSFIEVHNAKGEKLAKTTFNNHLKYNDTYFPMEITSISYQEKDSIIEKVTYSNPQFNVPLPQNITNFTLPTNVKIKEVEW